MKKKLGTVLDDELLYRAKKTALAQRISLSQLLENALKTYLIMIEEKKSSEKNIVNETKGTMKISPSMLKTIMEEEGVYEA
jgi:hypothetical protein